MTARSDEDVRGLDVAVDDAGGMRGVQRVGNLDPDVEQRIQAERAGGKPILQRRALQVLHDDERTPVLLADVMDGADVRVVQRRRRPRFTRESAQCVRIRRELVGDELERHRAAESRVFGLIHDAHAAAADLFDDVIVGNSLANQGFGSIPGRFDRRPLQEVAGRLFQQEQRSEVSLEPWIARAQLTEKHLPVRRRQLQCRLQQAVELSESVRIHRLPAHYPRYRV